MRFYVYFSVPGRSDDYGEENEDGEELLGDDFLDGSGDDEEHLESGSDSDEGDIQKESDMLDREQAKEEADAEDKMLDFNKEAGYDVFRLPTEEELEEEARGPPYLPLLQSRIKESADYDNDFFGELEQHWTGRVK
ncbi:hypothetical protein Bca4012_010451 [Brassica carinata]